VETRDSAYGACACGAELEARLVDVSFSGSDPPEGLRSVPQAMCGSCGTRIYKAVVIERIEAAYAGMHLRLEA